ncbi:uncharacterized protein ecscr isoform X2 [Misgurnus anguillicaudatus]|uniref:uncharacterized protein ecscr isoform X2 n=1 Tax=Misgurnus anguillicaudatus TaxID=75329 RepID=UPI003CCF15C8
MEQLFYILIIPYLVSSSIISEGNDTNNLITTTSLPNTATLSPRLTYLSAAAQSSSEKSLTTSFYNLVMTNHKFPTVTTTTMTLLSSRQTGTTAVPGENGQSSLNRTSGHTTTIITSLPITSSKSYTKPTQHAVSSSVARLAVDVSGNSTLAVHSNLTTSEVTPAPAQDLGNSLTMLAFGVMSLILILIVVMVILVTTINFKGRCKNTKQQEGIKNYDSMVTDSNMTNNCDKESITLVSVRTINTDYDADSPRVSSVHSTIVDNEEQELNRDLLNIRGEL